MLRRILLVTVVSLFVFGMSALSFGMTCGDHSGGQQVAQAHSGHEHGATEATKDAAARGPVNVGNKICPVSGEKIEEKTKVTYEYEGKVYNLCCASCIEEFKKDPEKYIKKVEQELQAKMSGQATSGMHEGHHH
ncbi:MAG: YHS domain-containing protein [Candidatus Omnitrophica bacterium]|nr:YHS domain-containing protein [Candidatus Omnitrophota bacterium]